MRIWIIIGILVSATGARADVSAAARAFADGQAAQLEGDYDRAARGFELAYSIAPSKEALRSAVRAHMQANHLPRAATLAAILAESFGADTASAQLATEVLGEAKGKLGRIEVVCAKPCTLAIDSRAVSLSAAARHVVYVAPGHQSLSITFEGDLAVTRAADLAASAELVLRVDPPPPAKPTAPAVTKRSPPPPPHRAGGGMPRAVPIIGGVIALGLGGAATWSGMDTIAAHDSYAANPTPAGWSSGRSKQLRTNILIGSAVGVGVASVVVGLFWTRWHDAPAESQPFAIAPTAGGATFSFGGSF